MGPNNGSGNHLQDQLEEELEEDYRNEGRLECGCRHICQCDQGWDDRN